MKKMLFVFCAALISQAVAAQTNDPIVMKVNGEDVTRSEFEYSYNKNNTVPTEYKIAATSAAQTRLPR